MGLALELEHGRRDPAPNVTKDDPRWDWWSGAIASSSTHGHVSRSSRRTRGALRIIPDTRSRGPRVPRKDSLATRTQCWLPPNHTRRRDGSATWRERTAPDFVVHCDLGKRPGSTGNREGEGNVGHFSRPRDRRASATTDRDRRREKYGQHDRSGNFRPGRRFGTTGALRWLIYPTAWSRSSSPTSRAVRGSGKTRPI
jgi:hypothetical protein